MSDLQNIITIYDQLEIALQHGYLQELATGSSRIKPELVILDFCRAYGEASKEERQSMVKKLQDLIVD